MKMVEGVGGLEREREINAGLSGFLVFPDMKAEREERENKS